MLRIKNKKKKKRIGDRMEDKERTGKEDAYREEV